MTAPIATQTINVNCKVQLKNIRSLMYATPKAKTILIYLVTNLTPI